MQTSKLHLHSRRWVLLCSLLSLCLAMGVACSSGDSNNNNTNTNSNSNSNVSINKDDYAAICPGSEGCDKNEGELKAGAAAVAISPTSYEVAWWPYYKEEGFCPTPTPKSPYGLWRCGELQDLARFKKRDCGRDGVCKGEKIKTRATCSATEQCPDGLVCNETEKRCYIEYKGPDADGSEGDGNPDWFLDCGRDRICPCMDPNGQPAYYGKDKKCLVGHKENPEYKGPDADGSEGNKQFEGLWMGGFSNNHPLQGKNDDTWSRALVLQSGDTTVAIVSLDTVGFFYDDVDVARKQVMEKLPKGAIDYIIVSATHTHEGPDTLGQWGPSQDGVPAQTGVNPKYNQKVIDDIAKSIMDAYAKLKPAKLRAGAIRTGGVATRGQEGLVRDSRQPIVVDDTLTVLQAVGTDGTPIATLVNWGNHPEALSDTNNFLSSDFCHYLREALEKGLPAGKLPKLDPIPGVAIFLQGAVGGLMTQLGVNIRDIDGNLQEKSDWDKTKALGDQLAHKAHEALKTAKELKDPKVSVLARKVKLAVENLAFQSAFLLEVFKRKTYDYDELLPLGPTNQIKILTEVAIIRVGEFTFFSMPGELDPEVLVGGYDGKWSGNVPTITLDKDDPDLKAKMEKNAPKGPYLKERVPGTYKAFIGLGNDEVGYLIPSWNYVLHPTEPYYEQAKGDHYEETNGLGPNAMPTLMKVYDEMLGFLTK
ncbi:MAG: hypothetical protein EP343_02570 [Deltaproteobacteria bacterium]|nr:MAG: hypothetical protein EP343_02570 [Deltaproteobacteria bacterium]